MKTEHNFESGTPVKTDGEKSESSGVNTKSRDGSQKGDSDKTET